MQIPGHSPEEDIVPRVVSVRLRHPGQLYDFEAGDHQELSPSDWVIVETARGQDAGQVVVPPREITEEQVQGELKPVVRLATPADLRRMERFRQREAEALERTRLKVEEHNLPMRLVAAEYTYNGRALTIYFTAEKRVDFRQLVKDLARSFRARIELRQIGARDEARLLGGIGTCGKELCCCTFLRDFLRISVRMAKEQDLPLSPSKISGVCGRLLCCLSYECDQYREIKAQLPEVGEEVTTLRGRGQVTAVSIPREAVTVEIRPGLTVEATREDLDRAAELEAAGKLPAPRSLYELEPGGMEEETARPGAPPSPPTEGREKRRRRRKKKTSKETPVSVQDSTTASGRAPGHRRRSRRPPQKEPRQEQQRPARQQTSPKAEEPSSSTRRRRRPRRRRGQDSSPEQG